MAGAGQEVGAAAAIAGLALLAAVPLPAARAAGPALHIDRAPPVEEIRTFRPVAVPNRGLAIAPDWAAVTYCYFTCRPDLEVSHEVLAETEGTCRVRSRIDAAVLGTELLARSWLPPRPERRLEEHEEGHRRICLAVYREAEAAAREAAVAILGRSFEGRGTNCLESMHQAVDGYATTRLRRRYETLMSEVARRASAFYDLLTEHGSNLAVPTALALEHALSFAAADLAARFEALAGAEPPDDSCPAIDPLDPEAGASG